jgi:hypothetical protein
MTKLIADVIFGVASTGISGITVYFIVTRAILRYENRLTKVECGVEYLKEKIDKLTK